MKKVRSFFGTTLTELCSPFDFSGPLSFIPFKQNLVFEIIRRYHFPVTVFRLPSGQRLKQGKPIYYSQFRLKNIVVKEWDR